MSRMHDLARQCKVHVLSWTLSKQDFICSWCCCSNTFLETSNKKRCSTGKRCWIYSSAKITLFLSPPYSQRQLPAFPRLPDGARYPELSPTLALRTTGQTKTNKQKSHTSGQQFFQFSGRQSSWDYIEREGQGEHKPSPSSFWRCWQLGLTKIRDRTSQVCQHAWIGDCKNRRSNSWEP